MKISKDEKKIIEDALKLRIELCKDAIHDNIYFKDEDMVEECKEKLKNFIAVTRKVKKARII